MIYIFQGRTFGLGRGAQEELYFKVENRFCNHLHEFSGSSLKVLFALASHIDSDGYCYPSIELIAAKTGLGRQAVSQSISALCKMTIDGERVMLAIQEKQSGGTFRNNRYILFPSPDDLEKYKSVERKARKAATPAVVPQTVSGPATVLDPTGGAVDFLADLPAESVEVPEWLKEAGGFEALDRTSAGENETPPQVGGDDQKSDILPDYPRVALPYTVRPYTVNESLTRLINNNTNDADASFGTEVPTNGAKKPRVFKEPAPELLPDTEMGFYLFNRLADEYKAAGRRPPAAFGSLEQKKRWGAVESLMTPGDLMKATDAALMKPILALNGIILYIEKIARSGGVNVRPERKASGGAATGPRPGSVEFREQVDDFNSKYQANRERSQAIGRAFLAQRKFEDGAGPEPTPEQKQIIAEQAAKNTVAAGLTSPK